MPMTRLLFIFAAMAAMLALPMQAQASNLYAGQYGEGGTWNIYELVTGNQTFWSGAYGLIPGLTDPTGGAATGHLVTITDDFENSFLTGLITGSTWIGLTDREGVGDGTWTPYEGNWQWVDDTLFIYSNWGSGEPNDAGGGEDAGELTTGGLWNDNEIGWGVDEPVPPTLYPGTSTQEDFIVRPYLIEWEVRSATQPVAGVDFPSTRTDPPYPVIPVQLFPTTPMPGPNGAAGLLGVREVRGMGNTANVLLAINIIQGMGGTWYDGQVATLDLADPDTNGAGGPVVGTTPIPFLSNNSGVDDDSIQTIIKGRVYVPAGKGGDWSVRFHSDDGFALRFLDVNGNPVPFTGQGELGQLDLAGTLTYPLPTGDSNSRGVITLADNAVYDIECVAFENAGGAFWEMTMMQGDYRTMVVPPNTLVYQRGWLPLGGTSIEEQTFAGPAPVKLVSAARVTSITNQSAYDITVTPTNVEDARAGNIFPDEWVFDGTVQTIALRNTGGGGAGSAALQVSGLNNHFPCNTSGGDVNDFETGITGRLRIDDGDGVAGETLQLTFAMFSDDNCHFEIDGVDFTNVYDFNGNTISRLSDIDFDGTLGIEYNAPTGNANTFGLITIDEGEYDFQGYTLEIGGGEFYEVWAAVGDYLSTGFVPGAFWPITTVGLTSQLIEASTALQLVDPTWTPGGDNADFNGDNIVDGNDFLIWQIGLGLTGQTNNDNGDANGDGTV
ncbi:MAG: hypothetical protein JW829_17680, partial [Pirellulales bacterium]|nr:hypothetical protein [Pirellulales bacterium]